MCNIVDSKNIKEILEVSIRCIETYPCKHKVTYIDNGGYTLQNFMTGLEILKLVQDGKWKDECNHFCKYRDKVTS